MFTKSGCFLLSGRPCTCCAVRPTWKPENSTPSKTILQYPDLFPHKKDQRKKQRNKETKKEVKGKREKEQSVRKSTN